MKQTGEGCRVNRIPAAELAERSAERLAELAERAAEPAERPAERAEWPDSGL